MWCRVVTLISPSTLKMEECSPLITVDIYKIKRRHMPEDSNFFSCRSYNLTSHIYLIFQNFLQKE